MVIRTKYSTPEPIRRASLYDSYKFVLDDLAEAEKRLDKEEDAYSNEYITSAAAPALHAPGPTLACSARNVGAAWRLNPTPRNW